MLLRTQIISTLPAIKKPRRVRFYDASLLYRSYFAQVQEQINKLFALLQIAVLYGAVTVAIWAQTLFN